MNLSCRKDIYRQIKKSIDNSRLDYFKRELKSILKKQIDGESEEVEKSFSQRIDEILKGYDRAHLVPKQVRAVNEKTGKSYMKTVYINPNKQYGLKKYHETDSKGSKIAIGKLMKAVDKCQSEAELYKLVLRNKGRFSDSEGKPLPIVAELRKHIDSKNSGFDGERKKVYREPVKDWIVNLAKETGLDIRGFKHKTTEDFERHVIKKHGNDKAEKSRGQVAVTENDLKNIDDVMNNPDIAVAGIKKNDEDRIVLVKNNSHGSILVEEVLSGKKNKALNAKTFWILDKKIDEAKIKKILSNIRGYDVSKMKTATPTVANSVLYSSQTDDGGRNSTGKNSGSNARSKAGEGLSNISQSVHGKKPHGTTPDNLNISRNNADVKESSSNETEKRAAEVKSLIESRFDKDMNDSFLKYGVEQDIKRLGKKKLEELANGKLKSDEEHKTSLADAILAVEKKDNEQMSDSRIGFLIDVYCTKIYKQKLAKEKLKSMAENENMVDVPVKDSDMKEAEKIIGSDVTRILTGADRFGNAKQGLVDKIKRRIRNAPALARAMLVYIKQEQEKTGKKVFTEKHSIWELLPKLNENADQAYQKGESETKGGVSGNLYEGDDGTTVVENKDWGRYQISFPGKPDSGTISMLKRNGFRWSPKTQTWVCFNTANGEYSLKHVAEKLGLKKTEIKKSSLEKYVEKSIRILKMAGAI